MCTDTHSLSRGFCQLDNEVQRASDRQTKAGRHAEALRQESRSGEGRGNNGEGEGCFVSVSLVLFGSLGVVCFHSFFFFFFFFFFWGGGILFYFCCFLIIFLSIDRLITSVSE